MPLDLRHTPVDQQFDTCDVAAVIGGEEDRDFGDLVAGLPHRPIGVAEAMVVLNCFVASSLPQACCDFSFQPSHDFCFGVNSRSPSFSANGFVARFELHEGTRATHVPEQNDVRNV